MHEQAPLFDRTEVLALIPARGGSKGLPGKNIAPLCGRPLIAHTIEAARGSRSVKRIVVTTDDTEIAEVACAAGAEVQFLRPAELATDTSPIVPVLQHTLCWLEEHEAYVPYVVVYLEPTAPLRTSDDIDAATGQLIETGADTVVALTLTDHHPFYLRRMVGDRVSFFLPDLVPSAYLTRQELPPVYRVNGSLIVVRREVLFVHNAFYGPDTRGYVMPLERSVNIDTSLDLRIAEVLLTVDVK